MLPSAEIGNCRSGQYLGEGQIMSSVLFFIFNFLATVWGRWDLSSPTGDQAGPPALKYRVLATGSLEVLGCSLRHFEFDVLILLYSQDSVL